MRPYSSFLHGRIASAAMMCALAVFVGAAVEFGYRLQSQRSVFVLGNWRAWLLIIAMMLFPMLAGRLLF